GEAPSSGDLEAEESAPDVRSIEDAAKRRAERRRIAVTPPGARAMTPQPVPRLEQPSPSSQQPAVKESGEGPALEEMPRDAEQTAAPQPDREPLFLTAPFPEPASTTAEPEEVSPMPAPSEQPLIATQLAQPSEAATEPAPSTVRVRQRTPVYGVWYSARATAHQRVVARQGTPVPRAYSAIRPRSGEVVTIAPPVEISDAPVDAEPETVTVDRIEVSTGPLPQPPRGPIIVEPDAGPGARRSPRRASRRIDAEQDVSRTSKLWGLLMTSLLIAALTIILLLIFRA
ncbi:MAG TPA: hypothetical protein VFT63_01775, partial [bacterium]|nr:hypothetical protein [bacterium]